MIHGLSLQWTVTHGQSLQLPANHGQKLQRLPRSGSTGQAGHHLAVLGRAMTVPFFKRRQSSFKPYATFIVPNGIHSSVTECPDSLQSFPISFRQACEFLSLPFSLRKNSQQLVLVLGGAWASALALPGLVKLGALQGFSCRGEPLPQGLAITVWQLVQPGSDINLRLVSFLDMKSWIFSSKDMGSSS